MASVDQGDFVCAAAVGSLGLFGNSILQLIACKLLADRAGLRLVLPKPWAEKYGPYFPALDGLQRVDADQAYSLPLVADRVVLSHAGWRTWALRHATGRDLAARLAAPSADGGAAPLVENHVKPQPQSRAEAAAAVAAVATAAIAVGGGAVAGGNVVEGRDGAAAAAARLCSAAGTASVGDEIAEPTAAARATAAAGAPAPGAAAQLSGRQLRAHFPQVSGKDLNADPAELAARLCGRGLWGWLQFPASYFAPYRESVRQLLALRPDIHDALQGALDAVLSARPPAAGGASGGVSTSGGDATADADAGTAPIPDGGGSSDDVYCEGRSAAVGVGCGAGEAREGAAGEGFEKGGRRRRRLVVLHLRRGDFRELPLRPPGLPTQPGSASSASANAAAPNGDAAADAAADGSCAQANVCHGTDANLGPQQRVAGPEPEPLPRADTHLHHHQHHQNRPEDSNNGAKSILLTEDGGSCRLRPLGNLHSAPHSSAGLQQLPPSPASTPAQKRRLRDCPPFEEDGVQGGAWCDKSGVDFRTPLEMYGAALAALPYDPDADLLWVCSDDPQMARRAEVCGIYGTSWAAAAAAAAAVAAADALDHGQGECGRAPSLIPGTDGGARVGAVATAVAVITTDREGSGEERSGGGGGDDESTAGDHTARRRRRRRRGGDCSCGRERLKDRADQTSGGPPDRPSPTPNPMERLRRLGLDVDVGPAGGAPEQRAARTPGARTPGDGPRDTRTQTAPAPAWDDPFSVPTDGSGGAAAAKPPAAATAAILSPEQLRLVSQHALLADWFVMQRADVLLSSNSTLSFTAAMLNAPAEGDGEGGGGGGGVEEARSGAVLLRPDPALGAFRRFDPWVELPLLPSAPVSRNHSLLTMQEACEV